MSMLLQLPAEILSEGALTWQIVHSSSVWPETRHSGNQPRRAESLFSAVGATEDVRWVRAGPGALLGVHRPSGEATEHPV